MKKIFTLLSFSWLLFSETIAQNNPPPAYEIKTDTAFEQDLDHIYWQLLEDKEGKWTIEQVSTPPLSDQFRDSLSKLKAIDTTAHTYWFRYRLKNVTNGEIKIALDSRSDQSDFYVLKTGGKREHFVTGYLYPWNKKDGFKQGNYIPVILQAGEELVVYMRAYNNYNGIHRQLPVDFVNTDEEIEREFYNSYNAEREPYFFMNEILEAFIVGLIFISIFFNLFFYNIVHEKVYVYFSLFLLFLGINRLHNILSLYTRTAQPALSSYVHYLGYAWVFILFFLIQFIRHFFRTFDKYPGWDKFLIGLGFLNILANLLRLFSAFFITSWSSTLGLITYLLIDGIPFSLFITLLLFIRNPDRFMRLVIIGALPLLFFYGILDLFIDFESPINVINRLPAFLKWVPYNFRGIEIICVIWMVLFFSRVLFLRYNQLRKENAQQALDKERLQKEKEIERNLLIAQQKIDLEKQVADRTAELKESLENLQSTQKQLIQSEKMASLGELTAGIAHEIQNPLNFVNNFSEVSNELIDEMEVELKKGNIEDAIAIAKDVKQNLEKILHHGKRADSIVKGMLQHSRVSTGQKELTDINVLVDECLRLSYHGLRAKDKSLPGGQAGLSAGKAGFNATMHTDFDRSIGKINIIPQDIGRVLLNLFNNAFYSITEKKRQQGDAGLPDGKEYEPTITVSTKRLGDKVEIRVKDNGMGIPQKVIDKIFQPFFTTKPTGQGTGLGLSLSYDIIKAHEGELKVETKEEGGAEFIILLPIV